MEPQAQSRTAHLYQIGKWSPFAIPVFFPQSFCSIDAAGINDPSSRPYKRQNLAGHACPLAETQRLASLRVHLAVS
jgi:hypothetical protein